MDESQYYGFSFLELLISLSVLVIGLLAIAKMELWSLAGDRSINLRSVAITEVNNLAEEISSEHHHFARQALYQWEKDIARNLPLGMARVKHNHHGYTIEVSWVADHPKHTECHMIDDPQRQCVAIKVKD